jgi:hypothetical protein
MRETRIVDRSDAIIAINEAKFYARTKLGDAPSFQSGFIEGLEIAIEILRAIRPVEPEQAVDKRPIETRST